MGDALKGAKSSRVSVPGCILETCRVHRSGERNDGGLFREGGGQRLADEVGVPLLGSVPLQPGLAALAADGSRSVVPIRIAQRLGRS